MFITCVVERDDDSLPDADSLSEVLEELRLVKGATQRIESSILIVAKAHNRRFFYCATNRSESRMGDDFKARLKEKYDNPEDGRGRLRCMLLDVMLPHSLITGALVC